MFPNGNAEHKCNICKTDWLLEESSTENASTNGVTSEGVASEEGRNVLGRNARDEVNPSTGCVDANCFTTTSVESNAISTTGQEVGGRIGRFGRVISKPTKLKDFLM